MPECGGGRIAGGKGAEGAGFLKKADPSEGVCDPGRAGEGDRGGKACARRSCVPERGLSGAGRFKADRGGKYQDGGIGADRGDGSRAQAHGRDQGDRQKGNPAGRSEKHGVYVNDRDRRAGKGRCHGDRHGDADRQDRRHDEREQRRDDAPAEAAGGAGKTVKHPFPRHLRRIVRDRGMAEAGCVRDASDGDLSGGGGGSRRASGGGDALPCPERDADGKGQHHRPAAAVRGNARGGERGLFGQNGDADEKPDDGGALLCGRQRGRSCRKPGLAGVFAGDGSLQRRIGGQGTHRGSDRACAAGLCGEKRRFPGDRGTGVSAPEGAGV